MGSAPADAALLPRFCSASWLGWGSACTRPLQRLLTHCVSRTVFGVLCAPSLSPAAAAAFRSPMGSGAASAGADGSQQAGLVEAWQLLEAATAAATASAAKEGEHSRRQASWPPPAQPHALNPALHNRTTHFATKLAMFWD